LNAMAATLIAIAAFVILILIAGRLAKYILVIGFIVMAIIILVVLGLITLPFRFG